MEPATSRSGLVGLVTGSQQDVNEACAVWKPGPGARGRASSSARMHGEALS